MITKSLARFRMDKKTTKQVKNEGIFKLGALVSIVQSVLFIVIALSALGLGVDRFIASGFGSLYQENPWLFLLLCGAFVFIAILGLAITPAEKELIKKFNSSLATLGSNLAYLGHIGTIAFFSWWIFFVNLNHDNQINSSLANLLMPVQWGIMFELFFVGLWVWIIAYVIFKYGILSKGFGIISIVKAICFWFTFIAFFLNIKSLLLLGLGLTTLIFGPLWHIWIAVIFLRCNKKGIK